MATEQITDDELLSLRLLANTRGGVKLGSSVLLRLLNTVAALRAQLAERCVVGPDVVTVPREELERIANSIEEDVDAIRSDWSDPRPRLKNIRYEIEAIRDIKDQKGSGK